MQSATDVPATEKLLPEFEKFVCDKDARSFDPAGFADALVRPLPAFAGILLRLESPLAAVNPEAARRLYFFLLEKRYSDRLNLLYFAFDIFDEGGAIPQEVIDRTPFPHEDGFPPFKYRLSPGFRI